MGELLSLLHKIIISDFSFIFGLLKNTKEYLMNYPLHCTVTYNNLLGRLYRGMRAVAEDALPL